MTAGEQDETGASPMRLHPVLIVDDRAVNLDVIEAMLQGLPLSVQRVSDGWAALAWLERNDPALVLLDVQMPGMDGIELARRIRLLPGRESTPLIFTTADANHRGAGYRLGAVDYLVKPLDVEVLRAKASVFIELFEMRSQLKSALSSVEQRNMQLKAANDDLSHFAYAASHDLREPLRSVGYFLERISPLVQPHLNDEAREDWSLVSEGVARMDRLIAGILSTAKLGNGEIGRKRVDLNLTARDVIADLHVAIREANATLHVAELPHVEGHPEHLHQLLLNLVGNSLKFRSSEPSVVKLDARWEDSMWRISVSDNGIGIPAPQQPRAFEIFQRCHEGSEHSGTGVGLSLCKRIARNHGGGIELESAPGRGTCVTVALPGPPPSLAQENLAAGEG